MTATEKRSGFHTVRLSRPEDFQSYADLQIEIDGEPLRRAAHVELVHGVNEVPQMVIRMYVHPEYEVELHSSDIHIVNVVNVFNVDLPEGTYLVGENTNFDARNKTYQIITSKYRELRSLGSVIVRDQPEKGKEPQDPETYRTVNTIEELRQVLLERGRKIEDGQE